MGLIKLIIKGNPMSVNGSYARAKNSFYATAACKSYKNSAGMQANIQYKGKPLTGNLEVEFKYYFPNKAVHDHLNFNKALNDALTGIVWKDDKQIKISHHYTELDKEDPRIELIINEIYENIN